MTDLQDAFDRGFAAVKKYVDHRFDGIEKRLTSFETKGLSYAGTWQRAADYARGNVVTHEGSAWISLRASNGNRPGSTPEDWQLMVKAGRDASR